MKAPEIPRRIVLVRKDKVERGGSKTFNERKPVKRVVCPPPRERYGDKED